MPSLTGSDNSVQVKISTSADGKGIDETNSKLASLEGHSAGSGRAAAALGVASRLAAIGITALGTATSVAGGFAVKSAASFEQTRIGIENMLGSADAAREVLQKVSKLAMLTPFQFPELAQGIRQLLAFGFSADDAYNTLTQLGDISAAIGAPIGDLAYLMGTLRTQGRAFTIDIRQFAMRGIPIYEYLAKVMHKNLNEINGLIEAGKVGFPEVQQAFQMMTAEGGKFHGTMAKQSQSLSGLWSTLKDTISQTGRELIGINQEGDIKQGSMFDRLRIGVAWLIQNLPVAIATLKSTVKDFLPTLAQWRDNTVEIAATIRDYLLPKLTALWNTVNTQLVPVLSRLWHEVIEPLIPVIGTLLVGAFGLLIDSLNFLLAAITPVINFLLDHKQAVLDFAVAFGILALAMKFGDIKTAFLGNMAEIAASIGGTKGKVVDLWSTVSGGTVMGGIATAGALADIALVMQAIQTVRGAISDINKAQSAKVSAAEGYNTAINDIVARQKAGKLTKEQAQKQIAPLLKGIDSLYGKYATGGYTGAGGVNEVAGVVHKGEYVIPKSQVDQSTGMPKASAGAGGTTIYQTNNIYNEVDLTHANRELGWRLATAT